MDYYTRKTTAIKKLDDMIRAGVPLPQIYLSIESTYGLSRKFVNEHLRNLKEAEEGI